MSCPKCHADLPEESAFCNKCGAALQGGAAPLHPLQPPVANVAMDPEKELWRGRFSGKAQGHLWVLWILFELPSLAFLYWKLPADKQGNPTVRWALLAFAVLPVLVILWSLMARKLSTRYRLTNYRIFKDSGILSRQLNEIELVRVDDVAVRQNIIQRVFNVGVVTVIAPHDQTEPRLELIGIENPIEVKELIRNHVRLRRKGSLNVENI